MDRAMHQSRVPGPRTLVTRRRGAGRSLQQLRRAAAQRAAAAPPVQASAAPADQLPAKPPRPLRTAARLGLACGGRAASKILPNSHLKIEERPVGARPLVAWGWKEYARRNLRQQ